VIQVASRDAFAEHIFRVHLPNTVQYSLSALFTFISLMPLACILKEYFDIACYGCGSCFYGRFPYYETLDRKLCKTNHY